MQRLLWLQGLQRSAGGCPLTGGSDSEGMAKSSPWQDEHQRVRTIYAEREQRSAAELWQADRPEVRLNNQALTRAFNRICQKSGRRHCWSQRVLDVGCGNGHSFGLTEAQRDGTGRWVGVELLTDRVRQARQQLPADACVVQGSGLMLPFADQSFEAIYLGTVLSSITERRMQADLVKELKRMLVPGGIIVVYDFRYPNPKNPDVVPVTRADIKNWFTGWAAWRQTLTLLPPLARRLAPRSAFLARAAEAWLPPLRSHAIYAVTSPPLAS